MMDSSQPPRSADLQRLERDPWMSDHEPRLRVCHISMHLKTGGLERLLVEFARRHDSDRFSLSFVALQELGPPAREIDELGLPVLSLDMAGVGKQAARRRLREFLKKNRCDVVHTHNTYAHFHGTLAARAARVPIVVNTQHGRGCGSGWKARAQFFVANRFARRVVGVSEDAARLCRRQDPLSRAKTICVWNGIDLERFANHGPRTKPVAVTVSRLSPEKDLGNLLNAIALARREVPDLRLKIVGDGSERRRLEQQARDLQIEDRLEFLGERSDVPALLAEAGFYVSSSRTEGISLTLLEAMAVGLPVVATRVGGNPEIVDDGTTGHLVPAQDPPALAGALVQMCEEQDLWPAMGLLGRQRVETHFDVRRMVADYEGIYEELCEVHRL